MVVEEMDHLNYVQVHLIQTPFSKMLQRVVSHNNIRSKYFFLYCGSGELVWNKYYGCHHTRWSCKRC